jgi:opacity protein-like surface antigen
MSSFNTLLSFLLIAVAASTAHAEVLFEPSVGYRTESLKLTNKNTFAETKITMATPVYGLKLGYRSPLGVDLNLAGDYSSGKATFSPLEEKNSFTHSTLGAQLGISAMGLMKIYLGYGFSNELKVEAGTLNSDIKLKGNAYQAGLQFKISQWFKIGAQYTLNQFNSIEGSSYNLGSDPDLYYSKVDSQDISFTLSLEL